MLETPEIKTFNLTRAVNFQRYLSQALDHTFPDELWIEDFNKELDLIYLFKYDLNEFSDYVMFIICEKSKINETCIPFKNIPIIVQIEHHIYGPVDEFKCLTKQMIEYVEEVLTRHDISFKNKNQNYLTVETISNSSPTYNNFYSCSICYEENKTLQIIKNCNHSFCYECLENWIYKSQTCPMCRTPVM